MLLIVMMEVLIILYDLYLLLTFILWKSNLLFHNPIDKDIKKY